MCRCSPAVKVAGLSSWWLVGILQRTAYAQPPGPESDLSGRLEALSAKLEQKREEYHIAGMAIAVVKDDRVVLARGFGERDAERGLDADEHTLFAIGSSSKAFTATLCGMMVDEGRMSWDDPVSRHFPAFSLADEAAKGATVRDALSHRTGVARTDMLWYAGTASIEQVYAALGRARLKDGFRKAWNYNNNVFAAAGFAAAGAAGTDWDTMVRERIFEPLGMSRSTTSVKAMLADANAAKGYQWDEEKKERTHKPMRDLTLAAPAGAINSSALDMARWVRLQLGEGEFDGKRVVSKEALNETWTTQIAVPGGGYGMGWVISEWNGKRVVEHGGNIDGFAAQVAMLPDEDLGFVLLMNVTATALQGESPGMVWEALTAGPGEAGPGPIAAEMLGEYVGEYRFTHLATDVKALVKDGKLHLDVPGQMVYELKWPDEEGKWYFAITDAIAAGFVRDEKNRITSMTLYQAGLEFDLPRKGAPVPPPPYTEGELAQFTGEYHFEYLGRSEDWKVFVREGRLACEVPKQFTFTLRWPDEKGTWVFQELKELTCEFERDDSGAVVAMHAHQKGENFHLPRIGGGAAPADLPSIGALMEKRDLARAAYDAAGIVRLSGRVALPMQGVSGTVTTVLSGPARFHNSIDFPPFGFIRQSFDGRTLLSESIGEEFNEVTGSRRDELIRQGPGTFWADLRTLYDTVEVSGRETAGGVEGVVVKASENDGKIRARYVLNPENGLPLREETAVTVASVGAIPVTITYGDYREHEGMVIPFRVEYQSDLTGGMVIEYQKIESRVAETPATFTLAPSSRR